MIISMVIVFVRVFVRVGLVRIHIVVFGGVIFRSFRSFRSRSFYQKRFCKRIRVMLVMQGEMIQIKAPRTRVLRRFHQNCSHWHHSRRESQ